MVKVGAQNALADHVHSALDNGIARVRLQSDPTFGHCLGTFLVQRQSLVMLGRLGGAA